MKNQWSKLGKNETRRNAVPKTTSYKKIRIVLLLLLLFLNTYLKKIGIHMWEKEMHENNLNQTLWTQAMNIVNYEYLSLGSVYDVML